MGENENEFINNPYFIIFALIIIVSFCLLIVHCVRRSHQPREALVLVGLPGCGKTAIFNRMAYSRYRAIGTAPSETIDKYFSMGRRWRIVDSPGQGRLKYMFFNRYKESIKGIIFVIDLNTINENKYRIAEYLYKILNDPVVRRKRLPILFVCNRHDDLPMIDWRSVGRFLEKQIDIYRLYLSEQKKETTRDRRNSIPMEPFEFRNCPLRVSYATCPTFLDDSDDSDLEEIIQWIATV